MSILAAMRARLTLDPLMLMQVHLAMSIRLELHFAVRLLVDLSGALSARVLHRPVHVHTAGHTCAGCEPQGFHADSNVGASRRGTERGH